MTVRTEEECLVNRVIRWIDKVGVEYEADPRQGEKLLEEIDLAGDGVKGVVTPGVKTNKHQRYAIV